MKTYKLLSLILTIIILQNCSSINSSIYGNVKTSNVEQIKGRYKIKPIKTSSDEPVHYAADNFIHLIENKPFSKQTNLDDSKEYYVEIHLNSKKLTTNFIEDEKVIDTKYFKVGQIKGGYLHLQGKTQIVGIPYLLGTHSHTTTKITLDDKGDLVWHLNNFHGGGAFLIAFTNWSTTQQHFVFEKVD